MSRQRLPNRWRSFFEASDTRRRPGHYAGAVGIVAVTTGVAEVVWRLTGEARLAMVFLSGVLIASALLGTGPGYLAAILAFFIYNFYLVDPRFTFSMDSPEDAVTVIVFLFVAMLTGHLAGRVRDEAARAKRRAAMTSVLFSATREFSATSDENVIRQQLARRLAEAAKGEAVVRDGLRMTSEPPALDVTREFILAANRIARKDWDAPAATEALGAWNLRPLQVGDLLLGVAAWRPSANAEQGPGERSLVEILADAGAAAISRARLSAAKAEVETRAQTEHLRSTLLSSISHDVRTPLAAIMVSASSLRRYGGTLDEPARLDLASTIEEEAVRLDAFVGNLLNITRLESGALSVQRIGFSIPEVVERVVERRNHARRNICIAAAPGLPEGAGDPLLFEQAFGNVLENALKFSPPVRPVAVSIFSEDDQIFVEVLDEGPGVIADDLPRIFDKFFRSSRTAQMPGTGLGLAIAQGLVEGMGGSIEAENREGPVSGLRVNIQLPVME